MLKSRFLYKSILISIFCISPSDISLVANTDRYFLCENRSPKFCYFKNEQQNETIAQRFAPPKGYVRTKLATGSFGDYLRNLPLKPQGSLVRYYDGRTKQNNGYEAVVDLDIGTKNLHQCADAVMRLKADYHYNRQEYSKIHFKFTNGFDARYDRWRKGERIKVVGNNVKWQTTGKAQTGDEAYWQYLEMVFSYAGSYSLAKELKSKPLADIQVGDVFIIGGFPGHAVIVVDMAENIKTNEKVFMIAQSYMPAQEIQILKNLQDNDLSPWYSLNFDKFLITPEWTFESGDLKQFTD